jgi:hypothetical protein
MMEDWEFLWVGIGSGFFGMGWDDGLGIKYWADAERKCFWLFLGEIFGFLYSPFFFACLRAGARRVFLRMQDRWNMFLS